MKSLSIKISVALWLISDATVHACPSCKDHLAANGLDTGYAVSILIMILVPVAIVTAWTVLILRLRSLSVG